MSEAKESIVSILGFIALRRQLLQILQEEMEITPDLMQAVLMLEALERVRESALNGVRVWKSRAW
jgi:hypothetical protein